MSLSHTFSRPLRQARQEGHSITIRTVDVGYACDKHTSKKILTNSDTEQRRTSPLVHPPPYSDLSQIPRSDNWYLRKHLGEWIVSGDAASADTKTLPIDASKIRQSDFDGSFEGAGKASADARIAGGAANISQSCRDDKESRQSRQSHESELYPPRQETLSAKDQRNRSVQSPNTPGVEATDSYPIMEEYSSFRKGPRDLCSSSDEKVPGESKVSNSLHTPSQDTLRRGFGIFELMSTTYKEFTSDFVHGLVRNKCGGSRRRINWTCVSNLCLFFAHY